MRITSKGQVTIPQAVREAAGLMPGTEVDFVLDGATIRLEKVKPRANRPSRGQETVRRLRGTSRLNMTTDEYMRLVRGSWDDEPPGVLDAPGVSEAPGAWDPDVPD